MGIVGDSFLASAIPFIVRWSSSVCLTAVGHPNDKNHEDLILDLVHYPVVANPNPVSAICAIG
jgi:hypothetical protein